MYIFNYCNICPGDDAFWISLESTDRIPGCVLIYLMETIL